VRFGVCTGIERLDAVTKAGYDYIELNLSKLAALPEDEFSAWEAQIAASPLRAECFNGFCPGSLPIVGENANPGALAAYTEKALARASRLGGKIAVLGAGRSRNIPEGFSRETALSQLSTAFDLCATIAGKYGMTVALEPLNAKETNLVNTVAEALPICKQVNNPHGKCLADFFHISESGEPLDNIRNAGEWLFHTHLANPSRVMPESEEDITLCRLWAQALKDSGYQGRLSLEGHYAPDFLGDITRTRKILEVFNT
jgi:sugar phosphate isomerase/epimerase